MTAGPPAPVSYHDASLPARGPLLPGPHLVRGDGEAAGAGEQSQQPAAGHWAAHTALCSVGSEETGEHCRY